MKYLLDTNICIYLMKHQPPEVAKRFAQCRQGDVVISAITHAELEYGIRCCAPDSQHQNMLALRSLLQVIPVIPFDSQSAHAYALVRQATASNRSDALDKLIAAQALAWNLTVVTNNLKDFRRYPGLVLENWLQP